MSRSMTRRQAMQGLAALGPAALAMPAAGSPRPPAPPPAAGRARPAAQQAPIGPYDPDVLPAGVRSRFVNDINGLRVHVLEAGFEGDRPALLLLHGFPELAYSWRNVLVPLADEGYHVFAPDMRGYGRTTGWDADYDGDLASFRRPQRRARRPGAGARLRLPRGWPRSSATTSARPSRRGARGSGPTCSARWR